MNLCFKCFLVTSSIVAHSLVGILQQVYLYLLIFGKLSKNKQGNYEYSTITVIAYSEVFLKLYKIDLVYKIFGYFGYIPQE